MLEGGCCVEKGEEGYYYSAIRNKVAMGFPSSLSPIQLVSHLNGNIRLSFVRGGLPSSSSSPTLPTLFSSGRKRESERSKKKEKPFCCICRGPIKLPVAVNLQQQKLRRPFDHGISFPLSIFPFNYLPAISSSEWMQGSFAHTRVEIAFWLVLPVLVTTWLVISF
jgi:hypothetical protein